MEIALLVFEGDGLAGPGQRASLGVLSMTFLGVPKPHLYHVGTFVCVCAGVFVKQFHFEIVLTMRFDCSVCWGCHYFQALIRQIDVGKSKGC